MRRISDGASRADQKPGEIAGHQQADHPRRVAFGHAAQGQECVE